MILEFINIEQFISIILIHIFAVVSPGPDFAVVVKQSIKYGKKSSLLTSLGISCGILVHVFYCLIGVAFIISNNVYIYNFFKIAGAIYLSYLGISTFFIKSNVKFDNNSQAHFDKYLTKPFVVGLLTNLFNPKATLFFISLFSLIIDSETTIYLQVFYGIWMALITCLWFCLVSLLISSYYLKMFITKYSITIDKIMGIVLIIISIKILFT